MSTPRDQDPIDLAERQEERSRERKLKALQKRMRQRLSEGLERVNSLEPPVQSKADLDHWVLEQYSRRGVRNPAGVVDATVESTMRRRRAAQTPDSATSALARLVFPARDAIARWVADHPDILDGTPSDLQEDSILRWLDEDQARWDRVRVAYQAAFEKPAKPEPPCREPVDFALQKLMARDERLPEARQRMADARSERRAQISDERLLRARKSIEDAEGPQSEREHARRLGELFDAPPETMRERLKRLRKPRSRSRRKG